MYAQVDVSGVAAVALTAEFQTLGPGPRSYRSIFEGLITEFGTRKTKRGTRIHTEAWRPYTPIAPSFEKSPDHTQHGM